MLFCKLMEVKSFKAKGSLTVRCCIWPQCKMLRVNTSVEDSSSAETLWSQLHIAIKSEQLNFNLLFKKLYLTALSDSVCYCQPSKPTSVVLGTHNLKTVNKAMRYPVAMRCKHQKYNQLINGNDIMLLKVRLKGAPSHLPIHSNT